MIKISSLGKNLKILMSREKVSYLELSERTNIPIATLKRLRSDLANPTLDSLLPIAEYFKITLDQLIGIAPLSLRANSWNYIKIIQWDQVSIWQTLGENECEYTITDAKISKNNFALIVCNDDWPGFIKGSILIIDTEMQPKQGDYVVTQRVGSKEATLKQYICYEGKIYLKPLNPDFKSDLLIDNNFNIIGVMVQMKLNK